MLHSTIMQHAPWWMIHIGIGQIVFYAVPFLLLGDRLAGSGIQEVAASISGIDTRVLRRAYLALLVVTLLVSVLLVGRVLVHTVLAPPGWDFQALWLYGHVADSGLNPFLPGPYHMLAGPGPFVPDFQQEVLDVGSVYPPPTLLLFGAIGWLPLKTAILPWMLVQTGAFCGMVILLRKTFFPEGRWDRLALTLTLALLLPGTIATFGHGQVNFLAVLCVLAAWRTRDKAISGVYLSGAAVLKLLYGALWFYSVLRRRWSSMAGFLIAATAALLGSIAAFGWTAFSTYLVDNPATHRMPSYYFQTFVNQSLLGASLRLVRYSMPPFGPPIHDPLYVISAAIVGVATFWAVIRQPQTAEGEDASLVLLILGSMLIYPWTLSNYFVLLLIPMGYLWARSFRGSSRAGWTIILLSVVYPNTYYWSGLYSIVATLLLWISVMVIAIVQIKDADSPAEIPLRPSTA